MKSGWEGHQYNCTLAIRKSVYPAEHWLSLCKTECTGAKHFPVSPEPFQTWPGQRKAESGPLPIQPPLSQAPPRASVHSGSASSVWFLRAFNVHVASHPAFHWIFRMHILPVITPLLLLLLNCSVFLLLTYFLFPFHLFCKIAPGHMWLLSTWNMIGQCWDVLSVWNIVHTSLWKLERKSVDCLISSFLYWLCGVRHNQYCR